jgi:uncharacterized protein (DUF1697 family)
MKIYLALFRGINVGGNNMLPMKELISIMQALDCASVKTYIQSGNVVFTYGNDIETFNNNLAITIEQKKGFRPNIHILTIDEFNHIASQNPYAGIDTDLKTVHINYLLNPAINANLPSIEDLRAETEQFTLTDDAFFLYAPDGIGRSKLVAKLEKLLGVPITGRNLRTVNKLSELLHEIAEAS